MPLARSYISNRGFIGNSGARFTPIALIRQAWTNPTTADTDGFSASHAGAGAAGTTNMTLGGALAGKNTYARNIVITVTHGSAVVAMNGIITGTGIDGKNLTEAWSVTAGTTSKTFTGKKAFKTVTSITETIAATAAANTIIAGDGVVFGLSTMCDIPSAVKEMAAGSLVTNGTIVAASTASTADPRGTYAPNSAPNGTNDYIVYFLSSNPENDRALP